MSSQNTRYESIQNQLGLLLTNIFNSPWKKRSLGLISLLFGYTFGTNITVFYLAKTNNRPLIALIIVVLVEILVRIRSSYREIKLPIYWLILDNIRIGLIFSIVLEAFKIGS